MDRQMILAHLEMALRHAAQGREHVAKQKEIVARLKRDGHETAAVAAAVLLQEFEMSQQLHEQEVEQMQAELAAHDASDQAEH